MVRKELQPHLMQSQAALLSASSTMSLQRRSVLKVHELDDRMRTHPTWVGLAEYSEILPGPA